MSEFDITPPPRRLPPPKEQFHRSVFSKLRGYFLAGILVTAPISITIYLTWSFLKFIDQRVAAIIPTYYNPVMAIPGFGVLVALAFFIVIGWFTRNYLGRLLIDISEYVLQRMPVINTVYGATKQVFETLMGSKSKAFREVVLFQYPREGIWTLGLIAGTPQEQVTQVIGEDIATVFLPTAPSPTNGIILFIPTKDLQHIDMSVEEAFKWILSGGILSSTQAPPAPPIIPAILKKA